MHKAGESIVRGSIRVAGLRAIDVGRGWRIAPEDLDDFFRKHANRPHCNIERTAKEALNRQGSGASGTLGCSPMENGKTG